MHKETNVCKKISRYSDAMGMVWETINLLKYAEKLTPFNYDLSQVNIDEILFWKLETMRDFLAHCRRTNEAELNFPIILNSRGRIMDGQHRIEKALLEGRDNILAVRFEKDPPHDYIEEKAIDKKMKRRKDEKEKYL